MAACLAFAGFALTTPEILGYASLGNSNHCLYNLSARLADADTIIFGSSRMRRGIDPDQLAEALAEDPGRTVNFGMPGQHVARTFLILRNLLERTSQPPRRVIVEANLVLWQTEGPSYNDYQARPDFAAFATLGDLASDAGTKAGQSVLLRARDLLQGVLTKLDVAVAAVTNGRVLVTLVHSPRVIDRSRKNICWATVYDGPPSRREDREHAAARDAFFALHRDWFDDGHGKPPRLFRDTSFSRDIHYMKAIVAMGRLYGFAVFFAAVPTYYTWPPEPEFIQSFEDKIGAPLLIPDKVLLKAIIDAGYVGDNHLLPEARRIYTKFIADGVAGRS